MIMKKKLKRSNKDLNSIHYGPEPILTHLQDNVKELGPVLNWYAIMTDNTTRARWLNEYVKENYDKDFYSSFLGIPNTFFTASLTAIARQKVHKAVLGGNLESWLDTRIRELQQRKGKSIEPKTYNKKPKKSIQQLMEDKLYEMLGEVEHEIDEFIDNDFTSEFNMYEWCEKHDLNAKMAALIAPHYRELAIEVKNEEEDEQLKEGYAYMGLSGRRKFVEFLNGIIDDAERWANNKKQQFKPRMRKSKLVDATTKVKRLKFKQDDRDLKISSINPATIIGASELWVYNTKSKVLQVYRGKLDVRGTTIYGYGPNSAKQKSIGRSPAKYIKKCLEGGKLVLRKLMDEINSTEKNANGRINEHCILLRVDK